MKQKTTSVIEQPMTYVKPTITKLGQLADFVADTNQGGAIDGAMYEISPGVFVHPTGPFPSSG